MGSKAVSTNLCQTRHMEITQQEKNQQTTTKKTFFISKADILKENAAGMEVQKEIIFTKK